MSKEIELSARQFGARFSPVDVRDYKLAVPVAREPFPLDFELKMGDVKDQGKVSSCVAHALSEVVEYFNFLQEGSDRKMSTSFIYGNRRNSNDDGPGMYTREALANLVKYGDVYKENLPQNVEVPEAIDLFENCYESLKAKALPNRVSTYFKVKSDIEIKDALMMYGPVVFAMN